MTDTSTDFQKFGTALGIGFLTVMGVALGAVLLQDHKNTEAGMDLVKQLATKGLVR